MFVRPAAAAGDGEGRLVEVHPQAQPPARPVVIGSMGPGRLGSVRVEVVSGGWRFELEVEPEARARLRDRAMRVADRAGAGSVGEVHAMIPGRVVSVAVAAGDIVAAGQALLVVEAMKMQNEVPAPSAGRVARVVVSAGDGVELGDVLVVLEGPSERAIATGPGVSDGSGEPA